MADDWLIAPDSPGARSGRPPARPTALMWLRVRYRLAPWWVRVLAVFLLSRVVTTALLLAKAAGQPANAWTDASPGYFDFASIWDGRWYYIIAVSGYPDQLPMTADGHVAENAWAFMPVFPLLARVVMLLTGLDFPVVAPILSVVFAAATAVVFYMLMAQLLPAGTAMFAVVLYCFAPLSPLLQVSYAESMHAFFLTLALYLLVRRQYWLLVPAVIVVSLTRPGGLAFALALGLHVVYRLVRRRAEPFPWRERVAAGTATLAALVSGFAWVVVAGLITGVPTAYTDTELAWRSAYVGHEAFTPFVGWVQGANFWVPQLPWGPVLLVVAIMLVAVLLFSPAVKRLGVDVRLWLASYLLYVLAVFFPQSSTFRILFPVFPALGALAQPRSPVYRVGIVLVFIALQWGWIHIAWWVDGVDWTPP